MKHHKMSALPFRSSFHDVLYFLLLQGHYYTKKRLCHMQTGMLFIITSHLLLREPS